MTPHHDHASLVETETDAGSPLDEDADESTAAAARAEHLKAAPDTYLICREGGHRLGLDSIVRAERIRIDGVDHLQITRHCSCCTTERVDVLTERYAEEQPGWLEPRHELVSREYRYPEHYAHAGGRIPRGEVRSEWFRRHPV